MTGSFAVDVFRGSGCLSDMICDIWRFESREMEHCLTLIANFSFEMFSSSFGLRYTNKRRQSKSSLREMTDM